MREKDIIKVNEIVCDYLSGHYKGCHQINPTFQTSAKKTTHSRFGDWEEPVMVRVEMAVQAILDHLGLELHVEPASITPEKVVARRVLKK